MKQNTQRKRVSKRLLVAALGVASVSYVQAGCAPDADLDEGPGESSAAYDDEVEASGEPGVSQQSLSSSALTDVSAVGVRPPVVIPVPPPVGNLVPPPPVGNLVPPPVIKPIPIPYPPGNLMAPPHDFDVLVNPAELATQAIGKK